MGGRGVGRSVGELRGDNDFHTVLGAFCLMGGDSLCFNENRVSSSASVSG